MSIIQPRTLTNKELVRASAELLETAPLPEAYAIELVRRLNYYTEGVEDQIASIKESRQLELPL